MKVLFLSAWYPHRYDSMAGLFVQKHAEAVSLYADVTVLYVHADDKINKFEIKVDRYNNVDEYRVYYPVRPKGFLYKANKLINFARAYRKGFRLLRDNNFNFDLIHANILTRTPFIAYLNFIRNRTPYVITEHWSRYLPERNQFNGNLRRWLSRVVVSKARAVLPVSENLKKCMISFRLNNENYQIINNVVEDFFFSKQKKDYREKKRIIHISCFDEKAKNMKGMLRAVEELNRRRQDFEFIVIGTGIDYEEIKQYCSSLGINKGLVSFLGELPPELVAYNLKNADFSCMFSNYENVPVVLSESLACGVPVVSTDVGGIKEHINNTNGILVSANDEKAFEEALNYMLDHYQDYDADSISFEARNRYSYENVGKQIFSNYKRDCDEI